MSFDVKINGDYLEIKNNSDQFYENCLISLKNIFFDDLVFEKTNIAPNDDDFDNTKSFFLGNKDFKESWINKEYMLKIYSNDRLIYDRVINDKSKCFVLVSNEKYEKLTINLIEQLVNFTDIDILHYTVGYETSYNNSQLKNIKIDIDRDIDNPHYIQFTKPTAFLDALSKEYKDYVFLDSDIQVLDNISEIFDYAKFITEGPILQRGCWDYTFVHGAYTPGELTKKLVGVDGQTSPYCLTNVVIFNRSHNSLFEDWKAVCDLKEVEFICENEFLHDEILFNCILWKNNITPKLFWFFINVANSEDVKFFLEYSYDGYEPAVDMNKHGKGYPFQSRFPYDKKHVFGFHCIKDLDEVNKVHKLLNSKNLSFEDKLLEFYDEVPKNKLRINPEYKDVNVLNHYINGAYVEIRSKVDKQYKVEFWNSNNICEYSTTIGNGMWTRTNKKYVEEYTCKVWDNDELVYEQKYNPTGKRVFITLESKSIGDTLAWFPYVDEYRKKWNCEVVCSTFWNHLFKDTYPEIEFVEPGSVVNNIYAMYSIGWFYNEDNTVKTDSNPRDFKQIPLGQTAADILGLDFKYVRAKINLPKVEKQKRVGIAIHSTAQTKYWNNPTGWQEVVDFLKATGYEVMILSKENDGYMGNRHPVGATKLPEGSMEKLMETMLSCEFFIGVGSGLSWVSWTLGIPTVLISGFSKPISEFEGDNVVRIFNNSVCNGCYNRFRLDAGDWNWCPDHKGTERQFECTKSITGKMVIDEIVKSGLIRVPNLDEDVLPQFSF
jgi:autotransporter strand-loop-strand O-heptosyltransferase